MERSRRKFLSFLIIWPKQAKFEKMSTHSWSIWCFELDFESEGFPNLCRQEILVMPRIWMHKIIYKKKSHKESRLFIWFLPKMHNSSKVYSVQRRSTLRARASGCAPHFCDSLESHRCTAKFLLQVGNYSDLLWSKIQRFSESITCFWLTKFESESWSRRSMFPRFVISYLHLFYLFIFPKNKIFYFCSISGKSDSFWRNRVVPSLLPGHLRGERISDCEEDSAAQRDEQKHREEDGACREDGRGWFIFMATCYMSHC